MGSDSLLVPASNGHSRKCSFHTGVMLSALENMLWSLMPDISLPVLLLNKRPTCASSRKILNCGKRWDAIDSHVFLCCSSSMIQNDTDL